MSAREPCEAVIDFDTQIECGQLSDQAVYVRARLGGVWRAWPVCAGHVEEMTLDLRSVPLVVTEAVRLGDRAAARLVKRLADQGALR